MSKTVFNMIKIILGSLILYLALQCSFYTNPEPSVDNIAQDSWELFEKRRYQAALSKFKELTYEAPEDPISYHGQGWCYLLLNEPNNAITNFNKSIDKGNTGTDPAAGLALAYHAASNHSACITHSQQLLTTAPSYYFEYLPLINYLDIRLVLSMSYYHQGQLALAQEEADFLARMVDNFPYNPDSSPLQSDSLDTWIINTQQYNSYPEALMALIDLLDAEFGM